MDSEKLMCKPHWWMVPADLRSKVITAWRSLRGQQARVAPEGERRLKAYREIRAQAIDAAERKLHDGVTADGVPSPAREL